MSDAEIIRQLIRDVHRLKDEQARLASMTPLYQIVNHNPVEISLTTNQNNYAIGDYDHLILFPTGAITITGIAGGTPGRVLFITTRGAGSIVYANENASSSAGNRIITISSASVTHTTRQTLMLIYIIHTGSGGTYRWYQVF
jgi:hypothetical protein